MTKNTVLRLANFFIGIPAFIAVVWYLGFARNILLLAVIACIQYLASRELAAVFGKLKVPTNRMSIALFSILASVCVYLAPLLSPPSGRTVSAPEMLFLVTAVFPLFLLAPFAFAKKANFPNLLQSMCATLFSFFYIGALGACLAAIVSGFGQSREPVLTFALMTFGNDALAWLIGNLLGRKRGIVDVSPNKSLAGFIGGICGSLAAGVIVYFLFPSSGFGSVAAPMALGLVTGLAVITGDLVESAIKRSVDVKDSGDLIPGRGGILDSFDSLLYSAPVFVAMSFALGFFGA